MPASVIDICNAALDLLSTEPIVSLDQQTVPARLMNRRFPVIRDRVCASHPWNILLDRAILADSGAPVWGPTYRYPVPDQCLRVWQADTGPDQMGWAREGAYVVSDYGPSLPVLFVRRDQPALLGDENLSGLISTGLAASVAFQLTGNAALGERILAAYQDEFNEARRIDSLEGDQLQKTVYDEGDWLRSRR